MEASMSLNALVRLPLSNARTNGEDRSLIRHSLFSHRKLPLKKQHQKMAVVEAKGKRGAMSRFEQRRAPPPSLPKIEDDGNPKFTIFIRMSNVYLWYPLSIITGGTTAKIMVAAKDNFLGKYIYKDAIARNLAAVIYKDEKSIQKSALKQYRALRGATEFKYGYKLVESTNLRVALSTTDVIELPPEEELKTVVDKVKDFFGEAKESFGKLTILDTSTTGNVEEDPEEKTK